MEDCGFKCYILGEMVWSAGWDLRWNEGGFGVSAWVPGESAACAGLRVCILSVCCAMAEGRGAGSESDGGESDDELGSSRSPERRSVTTEKPRADHGGYAGCSNRIGNA